MSRAARIVSTAPMGSTMPDRTPPANALPLLCPSARNGMEMIAPSGMFWMAMPRDKTSALAAVICSLPARKPAYMTPTAIPSGMLCRVTASTIIVVRQSLVFGPSACSLPTCRWGSDGRGQARTARRSRIPQTPGRRPFCPWAPIARWLESAGSRWRLPPSLPPQSPRVRAVPGYPGTFSYRARRPRPVSCPRKESKSQETLPCASLPSVFAAWCSCTSRPGEGRPVLVWRLSPGCQEPPMYIGDKR